MRGITQIINAKKDLPFFEDPFLLLFLAFFGCIRETVHSLMDSQNLEEIDPSDTDQRESKIYSEDCKQD